MSVQHYIAELPEPDREIMVVLRSWVLDLGSNVKEKISRGIPGFDLHGGLCYLSRTEEGVELGFTKGYELSDEQKLLESKGRKQVRSVTFHSVAETEENEEAVRHILNEAAILNEYHFRQKKKRKAK